MAIFRSALVRAHDAPSVFQPGHLLREARRQKGLPDHDVPAGDEPFIAAPDPTLFDRTYAALRLAFPQPGGVALHRGATWTTGAPYRETEAAIAQARDRGVLAVEMEAAELYARSAARAVPVVRLAHVTNTMGQRPGDDFEKGEAGGSLTALRIIEAAARAFSQGLPE